MKATISARWPDEPKVSCSSFIATSRMTDGGIVLGRNTMTSYTTADCNLVLEIVPRKGRRILMQARPAGCTVGPTSS